MLSQGGNKKESYSKIFIKILSLIERNINMNEISFLPSRSIHFKMKIIEKYIYFKNSKVTHDFS